MLVPSSSSSVKAFRMINLADGWVPASKPKRQPILHGNPIDATRAVKFRDAAESPLWFTPSDHGEIAGHLGADAREKPNTHPQKARVDSALKQAWGYYTELFRFPDVPGVDCRLHLTKGAPEIYPCRYSGHLCIDSDAHLKPPAANWDLESWSNARSETK